MKYFEDTLHLLIVFGMAGGVAVFFIVFIVAIIYATKSAIQVILPTLYKKNYLTPTSYRMPNLEVKKISNDFKNNKFTKAIVTIISRNWRGEEDLIRYFLFYCVLFAFFFNKTPSAWTLDLLLDNRKYISLIMVIIYFLYIRIYLIVSLWRCARNTNHKPLFYMARVYAVGWSFYSLAVISIFVLKKAF